MPPANVGARPAEIDGCWSKWVESDVDVVLRSPMDSGTIKARRRFTGRQRTAQVSVTLPAAKYPFFEAWFRVNCQNGLLPSQMKTPYGATEYWAFAGPPTYNWVDVNAVQVNAEIYQLPGW